MTTEDVVIPVTYSQVPESERQVFLPTFFGNHYLKGEMLVYAWAEKLLPEYRGGFWNYYKLSNGGFFIAHSTSKEQVEIRVDTNGYRGQLTPISAGVVVTLFALNHLIAELAQRGTRASLDLSDKLTDHYYQLRDFIESLPDASEVYGAID
ncbi:antirestriction protein [Allopusillimonas ginsengisoli]|uniref:antirestriction protein n=1 Tax=Allopusillimonas ginsengisoli TaxID=453575 RepID=UPI0039C003E7